MLIASYILIALFLIPIIVYMSIKWGVVAWYRGREFIVKNQINKRNNNQ